MFNNLVEKAKGLAGKIGFQLKEKSPFIFAVGGGIAVVTGTVMLCKASTKLNDIVKEGEDNMNELYKVAEDKGDGKDINVDPKAIATVKRNTALKIVKTFGPGVVVETAGLIAMGSGMIILNNQKNEFAAAAASIGSVFAAYRNNVREKFGDEVDRQMRFGTRKETIITEEVDPETGEIKPKYVEDANVQDKPINPNDYAICFDEACIQFSKSAARNLDTLIDIQAALNNKLHMYGYLFLNDIRREFGLPETEAGHKLGILARKPDGSMNYLDFGIYDIYNDRKNAFREGYENCIWLDINLDPYPITSRAFGGRKK